MCDPAGLIVDVVTAKYPSLSCLDLTSATAMFGHLQLSISRHAGPLRMSKGSDRGQREVLQWDPACDRFTIRPSHLHTSDEHIKNALAHAQQNAPNGVLVPHIKPARGY